MCSEQIGGHQLGGALGEKSKGMKYKSPVIKIAMGL